MDIRSLDRRLRARGQDVVGVHVLSEDRLTGLHGEDAVSGARGARPRGNRSLENPRARPGLHQPDRFRVSRARRLHRHGHRVEPRGIVEIVIFHPQVDPRARDVGSHLVSIAVEK